MASYTPAKVTGLLIICWLTSCATSQLRPHDQTSLQAAFDKAVKSTHAIGGVAIVKTPEGRFDLIYGVREIGQSTRPTVKDHFRIGSVTKTMVAAVIMQLAQEGKIGLNDPVSKYRADVPNGDKITIQHLLAMRSGLFNYTTLPEIGNALDTDPGKVWTSEQLLALAFQHPPRSEPGTEFYYCNTNTVLLGTIAEQLDKKPLAQLLKDRLFLPLGMKDTSLPENTNNNIPSPHPQAYLYGSNYLLLTDSPLPPDLQTQLDEGSLQPKDVTQQNPSWAWAAGAAISTAEDMVIWIEALVNGRVLNQEFQQKWFDSSLPLNPSAPGQRYGIGHFEFVTPAGSSLNGHFGLIPGYNTWVFRDSTRNVTIVAWANVCPNTDVAAFFGALQKEIYPDKP